MAELKLKPCPFCGGEAVLSGKYTIQGVDAWAVYCGITPNDFFCGGAGDEHRKRRRSNS